ncbi:MAG: hypothetical protein ABIG63_04230 [Chloroflexota bacterium]
MSPKRKHKGQPTFRGKPFEAIMEIKTGEEIAGAWVTTTVPGIGFYKLLAKRKADGACEWVHFVQRADGSKDKFLRGDVENEARMSDVVEALNRALRTAYGPGIKLQPADTDVYPVDGTVLGRGSDKVH